METKTLIWIGIIAGSIVGGIIGTWLDHGNGLGPWTLLFGGLIGPIVGIWANKQFETLV